MAIRTVGTHLYVIDPYDDSLITVGCVTAIDGIDTTVEQVETTCLSNSARTYTTGLATPGSASFTINFDPSDDTHTRLHELKVDGESLSWAVGFGDGTAAPTIDSVGEFVLPTTRSWIAFDGFMNSFPFSFPLNGVVTSNVGVQISGEPTVTKKA
jgi:hypothetical protein